MTTTTEFLQDRLLELELAARATAHVYGSTSGEINGTIGVSHDADEPDQSALAAEFIRTVSPAFILWDIKIKREILSTHDEICVKWHQTQPSGEAAKDVDSTLWYAITQFASAFRNHYDFPSIRDE